MTKSSLVYTLSAFLVASLPAMAGFQKGTLKTPAGTYKFQQTECHCPRTTAGGMVEATNDKTGRKGTFYPSASSQKDFFPLELEKGQTATFVISDKATHVHFKAFDSKGKSAEFYCMPIKDGVLNYNFTFYSANDSDVVKYGREYTSDKGELVFLKATWDAK